MSQLATGPGALFGYLNNAFSRANNATQRMFDHRDTLEDQRMRGIASGLNFNTGTLNPIEQAIENAGNMQPAPYESDSSNMQNAYDNWVSQNQNFVTPNNSPVNLNNTASLPQDKLSQAGSAYAYGRSGRQDDNPYNSPNITVEQGLANSLASQTPTEAPVTQYKYEGGDIPLNPTEYRERIAQSYSSQHGIPINLARQRVDQSGIFDKSRFMDAIERPQMELTDQIGTILQNQKFQQPDDYRNFMMQSGLLPIALRTGPYGEQLLPNYPNASFDLGEDDYFNTIYGD
tara:strand:- start:19394 stop:20257 length:864 start_codon:yes stop_codon:yes gene_type:complete